MGPGCAFLDYDNDGWQDILLVNSMDWPGHKRRRSTLKLYRNNRNGTFTDVTRAAGLDVELYGLGVAVGDFNNDGFADLYITCVGQSRLFQNTGRGSFVDVTARSGLGGHDGFSTSAMWFDYDRDGHLDLFVTNYVRWSESSDVFCSFDGKQKSYCTPEAYRAPPAGSSAIAATAPLRTSPPKPACSIPPPNRWASPRCLMTTTVGPTSSSPTTLSPINSIGISATAPSVRSASKPDSHSVKTAAPVPVWVWMSPTWKIPAWLRSSSPISTMRCWASTGPPSPAPSSTGPKTNMGLATRRSLGFGCFFFDANLDGQLDLLVVNGHIDETISRARHDVTLRPAAPPLPE